MRSPLITDTGRLSELARQKKIPALVPERDWKGETVAIIGNGTSLLDFDFSTLVRSGVRTMMANDGYKLYDTPDVLMCSDRHWLADNSHDMSDYKGDMIVVTHPEAVKKVDWRMMFMKRAFIERWSGDPFSDPSVLVEGHTSTSTNIALAVHRGVKRIILLGIDLRPGKGGLRRAVGSNTDSDEKAKSRYAKQVKHLTAQAKPLNRRGVEVINCSPMSALTCYPYAELEDVL